jgi:hypothetical protein
VKLDVALATSLNTKTDPLLTVAEQVFVAFDPFRVQLIVPPAPTWLLTCPPPVSPVPGVTLSVKVPGPFPKFARTVPKEVVVMVHVGAVPALAQESCHPVKMDPAPGVSVNVTFIPTV